MAGLDGEASSVQHIRLQRTTQVVLDLQPLSLMTICSLKRAHRALLAIVKSCTAIPQSHDHMLGAWQLVCIYIWLPCALLSCQEAKSSLMLEEWTSKLTKILAERGKAHSDLQDYYYYNPIIKVVLVFITLVTKSGLP